MIDSTPDLGSISANRSAVAGAGATSQRPGAGPSDGDPSASRIGAGANLVDQHGAGTDEVLRGAAARLQPAQPECGEGTTAKPGAASGAGTVARSHLSPTTWVRARKGNHGVCIPTRNHKLDEHCGFHLDRRLVEEVRFVLPLLDGVDGSRDKQGMPGHW